MLTYKESKEYRDKIDKAVEKAFLRLREAHEEEFLSLLDAAVKEELLGPKEVRDA